jgi:MFS family permease
MERNLIPISPSGEQLGRKKTFLVGVTIMSIGAVLQTCAFSVAQMIVARLITGTNIRTFLACSIDEDSIGLGNGCDMIIEKSRKWQ